MSKRAYYKKSLEAIEEFKASIDEIIEIIKQSNSYEGIPDELFQKTERLAFAIPEEFRQEAIQVKIVNRLSNNIATHNMKTIECWQFILMGGIKTKTEATLTELGPGAVTQACNKELGRVKSKIIETKLEPLWITRMLKWLLDKPVRWIVSSLITLVGFPLLLLSIKAIFGFDS